MPLPGRIRSSTSVSFSSSGRVSFSGGDSVSVSLHSLSQEQDEDDYRLGACNDIEEAMEATETPRVNSCQKLPVMPDEHVIPAGGEASDTDSQALEKSSMGSNDSKDQSKIGSLIDRAKMKGRKLVSKREKTKTPEVTNESSQCLIVSSPASLMTSSSPCLLGQSPGSSSSPDSMGGDSVRDEKLSAHLEENDEEKLSSATSDDPLMVYSLARRCRSMPFFQYRMVLLGALIAVTMVMPGFITGILWGLYVSFIGFLYLFVSDPRPKPSEVKASLSCDQADMSLIDASDEVDVAMEANTSGDSTSLGLGDGIVYRGWMNELKSRYSPAAYHVNSAQSVLVRLEGSTLRISRPSKAVLKHAFHEDPTLTQAQPTMVAQTIYDLTDAQVSLRPKRLAARRWWSRKYPIHIRFAHKASALAEVDLTKSGMTRSVSLHPVASAPDGLPIVTDIPRINADDDGYSAESETSADEEDGSSPQQFARSNSAGDLVDFQARSQGLSRKTRGRSIYLFVRAAREKERWFHLLREACAKARLVPSTSRLAPAPTAPVIDAASPKRSWSADGFSLGAAVVNAMSSTPPDAAATEKEKSEEKDASPHSDARIDTAIEFLLYRRNHAQFAKEMINVMGGGLARQERGSTVSVDLGTMKWRPGIPEENSDLVESINAFATRIFFDCCRDSFWANAVKQKIQSKLATIHLPYFIETLELSELDLGVTAPRIMGVYAPKMDEWGLWVDFEMKYQGGIKLMLQTSVNLLKLQSGAHQVETERKVTRWTDSVRVSHYSDEDLPESPESSPDEDFGSNNHADGNTKERTGKKILSIVERAAQSSLFQKAAKLSSVAKLIENVSSTALILNVEVEMLEGTMTINIPPPPSDRLWYAFRKVPRVSIRAVPQVGDRSVDMTTVSDWIESKLRLLIEKNLVCPNMDDIILPVMSGNSLLHMGYNH